MRVAAAPGGTALGAAVRCCAALALVAGCGSGTGSRGTALSVYPPVGSGMAANRVGSTFALVYAYLHSDRSAPPVTFRRIAVVGRGVGNVIRIERVRIVPAGSRMTAVPDTLYLTDPPVDRESGVCHVADDRRVAGYRLRPGADVRLLVVYRLERPGVYSASGIDVHYTVAGRPAHQLLPFRFYGTVVAAGPAPVMPAWERACVRLTRRLPEPAG